MRGARKVYALYKGDKFIDEGTLADLAERRGVAYESLRFMKTPAYQRRLAQHQDKGYRLTIVEIEGEIEYGERRRRNLPGCAG